jgi:hypothetical protein
MVDCCEEIPRYYRSLVHFHSRSVSLNPPMHGSHITVIAGKYETIPNQDIWKKYDGQAVSFEYDHQIQTDGTYFWLPVYCKEFENVRIELGLSPTTPIPWHLTIGNLKNSFEKQLTFK